MAVFIYLAVLVVAFFVFVVVPQRRRVAAHKAVVDSLAVGDKVITAGGIFGTVRTLEDASVDLEVAPTVTIRLARQAITRRQPEALPASGNGRDGEATGEATGPTGPIDATDSPPSAPTSTRTASTRAARRDPIPDSAD